ncbi:hypothetical protein VB738_12590 [Cyanobium gracile UHCC 0139]|uniref:Uncharacterized protein n=1 Tax=Cyanobium gracile UHCC 0139 TaxID=3110308 RepID=A0ABU5RWD6_9CYAN|nr:hypothetical protein [Cyanobium gracile]MEA5392096.1 hypothetical protein [Cyanobium gracile UHCC 0139]
MLLQNWSLGTQATKATHLRGSAAELSGISAYTGSTTAFFGAHLRVLGSMPGFDGCVAVSRRRRWG